MATQLKNVVHQKTDGRFYKLCPKCDKEQFYKNRRSALKSARDNTNCKLCSDTANNIKKVVWHRGIRLNWLNCYRKAAARRKYTFEITADDVADIYEQQGKKCLLTGQDLIFPSMGLMSLINVSIDRIDNDIGYTRHNIRLVTKEVNMMRGTYTNQEFINVCKAVATHMR